MPKRNFNKKKSRRNNKSKRQTLVTRNQTPNQDYVKVDRSLMLLNDNVQHLKWSRNSQILAVNNTGSLVPIVAINQGVSSDQRVGDRIMIQKIDFRFAISSGDTYNITRFGFVYIPGDPTAITLGTIFDIGPSSTIDVYSLYYPYSRGNSYEVLYDSTNATVLASAIAVVAKEGSILVKRPITYSYGTAVPTAGYIYWFAISDSGAIPHPSLFINFKVYYSDI